MNVCVCVCGGVVVVAEITTVPNFRPNLMQCIMNPDNVTDMNIK